MRNVLVLALLFIAAPLPAAQRDLDLAREMLDDAILRDDADGMQLARERLIHIVAATDDRALLRDAHYLIALSAFFESVSAYRDAAASGRIAASGVRHADRAVEIDPRFADAWMIGSGLRRTAMRLGQTIAPDPPGAPNRFQRAIELDATSPAVAFFNGMIRSINPAGPAHAEGVQLLDELAQRLDAERAATGRRFGLWDAQTHAFRIMVRIATEEPRAEVLRPMASDVVAQRPDFALGRFYADSVAERRFVAAPPVTWQPWLADAAGDGTNPRHPDVIAVDRAESGERLWYRITFREPLPRSFGANVVINRRGDPTTGMQWWGNGSTFRFDRLVTAWITRDGDRYFGRIGVTDDDGARGLRFAKIPADIQLAVGSDDRSLMIGVPRAALDVTDKSTFVVAAGSHLVWNDDAASAPNSR
ncbi:MAG TPA: hypothetical protein VHK90_10830 [Thermoanaerobaculia bacterium]|nr:hypothetical protein [Thermoanaerobaculia bacterium]